MSVEQDNCSANNESKQESFSVQPPKGTHDLLPGETETWQYLERTASRIFEESGCREIRLPIFEHTELFKRGVGETTDIVNKEMYTFADKSERSLTLRPEGTAGVVRAYLNGGMQRWSPPVKLWYCGPMFRYESIKTGRQRQFSQIGLEAFGSAGPLIDAEVIMVAHSLLAALAISDVRLQLNSIGCPNCRPAYRQALKQYLAPVLPQLCADCRFRYERNPLRMLDCKIESDQKHYADAPDSQSYLCDECRNHWLGLRSLLEDLGIPSAADKRLVRGLDYYTRTVFEFVSASPQLGVSSTVCAGGRYDNLVEMFGGPPTPAVGWALGVERLLMLVAKQTTWHPQVFIVSMFPGQALQIARQLRACGLSAELDYPQQGAAARKLSKQLQQANKIGALFTVIVGDDELAAGDATVKDMVSGAQARVDRQMLTSYLKDKLAAES